MSKLIENFKYRPEVDGLRAVAVLPVVLYHVGLGFPGGFVGVDVFFVISGFLITSLIIKEIEQNKFSFVGFWGRRARRIIPALAAVCLVTLTAGWFLLLPLQYADLGKSAAYMVMLIANVYFYLGTGYFAGASEEKPLLHTWSLAVEEQFYLFVPLILFGMIRFRILRSRGHLLLLFGAGIVLSLAVSVYAVTRHPAAAFYLLPTRAWELLIGCFIALLPTAILPQSRVVRESLTWIGLAAILIPCWIYSKHTLFPGLAALPPCLGAAIVIVATAGRNSTINSYSNETTLVATSILRSRALVFIGLISYSLYLWHWPLIAFSNYWSLVPQSFYYRLGVVILSIVLAALSWRFVETPFRKKRIFPSGKGMFVFSGAAASVLIGAGMAIVYTDGAYNRMPTALQFAYARNPQDDLRFVQNHEAPDVIADKLSSIGISDPQAEVKMLVWGDSHAMSAMPAFDAYCKGHHIAGRYATNSSRAPLLNWYGLDSIASKQFNEAVFEYIRMKHIPDVFLVACWTGYGDQSAPEQLQASIEFTIKELVAIGCQPWVILMVPNHHYEVPKAVAFSNLFDSAESVYCSKPDNWNGIAGTGTDFLRKMELLGAHVIDPRPEFLAPDNGHYRMTLDGKVLYRDRHHLSMEGALRVLLPLLERDVVLQR